MELVSSRNEFPLFEKTISEIPFTISLHPLSYLLSPMWQKLPYICNKFFYYNNLNITFLNYKSPSINFLPLTFSFFFAIYLTLSSFIPSSKGHLPGWDHMMALTLHIHHKMVVGAESHIHGGRSHHHIPHSMTYNTLQLDR